MKLNIGSGDFPAPNPWINVDSWEGNDPHIVTDGRLPLDDKSVDAIYLGHVLEHIEYDEIVHLLGEMRRVLKHGGKICAVGPDCDLIDPETDPVLYDEAVNGGHRWPGDEHQWRCTEEGLLKAMKTVFPNAHPVKILDVNPFWPVAFPDVYWQCAVVASK